MLPAFKLSGPVADNVRIKKDDTLQTKRALLRLGFLEPSSEGVTPVANDAMIAAIKSFQKENGIAKDGAMKPGGPTERLIQAALFEESEGGNAKDRPAFRIGNAVGTGGANRPEDVLTARRALSLVDIIPADEVNGKMADRTFDGAIEAFQRDFNLKRDGKITPGGETERALARVIRPALGKGGAGTSLLKNTPVSGPLEETVAVQDDSLQKGENKVGFLKINPTLPGHKEQPTDEEKKQLRSGGPKIDRLEEKFREFPSKARRFGAEFAAENMEFYLSGKGGIKWIPKSRIRSFWTVKESEAKNIQRFINDFLALEDMKDIDEDKREGESYVFSKIRQLKDGESILIKRRNQPGEKALAGDPVWDRGVILSGWPTPTKLADSDLFYGSGDSHIHSEGEFLVKREGNVVKIEGTVKHEWRDDYNWNENQSARIPGVGHIPDSEGQALEDHGRGKSFKLRSTWSQKVTGTLELRNGKTVNPRIRWGKPE